MTTTFTSLNDAIRRQTERVTSIDDTLKMLPGKLHDIERVTPSTMENMKTTLAKYFETLAKKNTEPPTPTILLDRAHLLSSIFDYEGVLLDPDTTLPDGTTASAVPKPTKPWSLNEDGYITSVISLVEEKTELCAGLTYIGKEINDLIQFAAESLQPESLSFTDLIAPAGFCFLEEPLLLNDRHPLTHNVDPRIKMGIRAFSWSIVNTNSNMVNFILYSDKDLLNEHLITNIEEVVGPQDDMRSFINLRDDMELIPTDMTGWAIDSPWIEASAESLDEFKSALKELHPNDPQIVDSVISAFRKYFLVLMRFCWQEIFVAEKAEIPRPTLRSMTRKLGKPLSANVIRLRRTKHHGADGTGEGVGPRLEYRLLVRGHWRNQYYRSLGPATVAGEYNPHSHRRIWIDPHMKGPDGAPLMLKHKVNALVR
jgi:hypothetical protein